VDSKGFFLGLIAAVVLYLLWEKSQHPQTRFVTNPGAGAGAGAGAGGCGGSCGGPSAGAAPSAQNVIDISAGTGGFVSPGTPPLNGALGTGSFYGPSGPTSDAGFLSNSAALIPATATVGPQVPNTPGSPTTPSNQVPTRALQPTGTYQQTGFQQRYNVVGVPRSTASRWVM
jgi:hypothetical protein